jgi:opacity protein-like surface antigen
MMSWKRIVPAAAVLCLLTVAPAEAQFTKNWKDWYGNVHGGWNLPQGDAGKVANDGWIVGGGATYYPDDWALGLSLGLDYMDSNIKRDVLDEFEASGGYVTVWGLTAGLTWSPKLEGSVGFYLNGGLGGYRVEGKLTEPGVVCGPICPPYAWWCVPGCLPGTIVTDSTSTTELGYNLGLGLTFQVGLGSQIYVEASYHRIETDVVTEMIPIVIGYRF